MTHTILITEQAIADARRHVKNHGLAEHHCPVIDAMKQLDGVEDVHHCHGSKATVGSVHVFIRGRGQPHRIELPPSVTDLLAALCWNKSADPVRFRVTLPAPLQ